MVSPLGPDWLSAFGRSEYSLRFELGGETFSNLTQPVPRFLQALDRARTIAAATFPADGPLVGVVGYWPLGDFELFHPAATPGETGLDDLGRMGFPTGAPMATWTAIPPGFGEEDGVVWSWNAYDLADRTDLRDVILWAAVAKEMAVAPKAPIAGYLYDPERQVLMHVYDDRGMDLTALDAGRLDQAYRQFNDWLLDYDRPRIDAIFADRRRPSSG
jgi:hypothetical protein